MGLIVTVRYESQDGRQMEMRTRDFRTWEAAHRWRNRHAARGGVSSNPHLNQGVNSWPPNVWCREVKR